ncbi:LysR family transcriptional regulator [Rhodococcus sp. SC4]|nr:LysR family transcriptional regulator [Rhodococcus sp. SC4]
MELRQLRYFIAVAEDEQFSKAAARLGVAQSTISEQVRLLEKHLDAELFLRSSRSVRLTSAGEALLAGARTTIAELSRLEEVVRKHAMGQSGELRVGAVGPALHRAVPLILRRLIRASPDLAVSIHTLSTEAQVRKLVAGELDVGFVRGLVRRRGLRVETLMEESLWAVLPSDHRLAGAETLSLSDLNGEPFVFWPRGRNPSFYDQLISTCHQHDCVPSQMIEGSDMQTQMAFIGAGLGVSVQPESFRDRSRDDVVFVPLSEAVRKVALQLAWSPTFETPAVRTLLHNARLGRAELRRRAS